MPWRECVLNDVVRLRRGHDLPNSAMKVGHYPVVASTDIKGFHNEYKAEGPVVVTGRSGSLGTIQYIADRCWPLNTTLYSTAFKGNDPRFVYYFLTSIPLASFDAGTGVPTLNRNHIKNLKCLLPKYQEQQKLAAILTAYDDLIENNRQRIALLEQMAEEIYREWFVRLRFPGHEHTPVHKGVPEGWEQKPLPDCISIKPREKSISQEHFPYVGMDRLSTTSAFFSIEESRSSATGPKFRNGDVLLPRITPCLENGKRGFVTGLADGEVATGSTEFIVLRGKTLPPEFVYCLSISDSLRQHAENSMVGASGRQRVQEACLNWMLINHPPKPLLDNFSEVVSPMYRLAEQLLNENNTLTKTRDLLLNRLISGKLRVDHLDIRFPPSMLDAAA